MYLLFAAVVTVAVVVTATADVVDTDGIITRYSRLVYHKLLRMSCHFSVFSSSFLSIKKHFPAIYIDVRLCFRALLPDKTHTTHLHTCTLLSILCAASKLNVDRKPVHCFLLSLVRLSYG